MFLILLYLFLVTSIYVVLPYLPWNNEIYFVIFLFNLNALIFLDTSWLL